MMNFYREAADSTTVTSPASPDGSFSTPNRQQFTPPNRQQFVTPNPQQFVTPNRQQFVTPNRQQFVTPNRQQFPQSPSIYLTPSSTNDYGNFTYTPQSEHISASNNIQNIPPDSPQNYEHERELENNGDGGDDLSSRKNILSIVVAGGKLGSAYYDMLTSELFLFPDITDNLTDFSLLKLIHSQVIPRHTLVCEKQDARLLAELKSLSSNKYMVVKDENIIGIRREISAECQLFIMSPKNFAPNSCKERLEQVKLPYAPKSNLKDCDSHRLFMSTLIPFGSETMVRAAGALLRFLDKNGIQLLELELLNGYIPVLDIRIAKLDELVIVDYSVWNSLRIFHRKQHPSLSKMQHSSKEGLSVFRLLNQCQTLQGSKFLRTLLFRPTRNIEIISRRLDVIEFVSIPSNIAFTQTIADYLKQIKNIPRLLYKCTIFHPSHRDWKDLYSSIYHCYLIGQLCNSVVHTKPIQLFQEIGEICKSYEIESVFKELSRVIDFETSLREKKFYPNDGINEELDERRIKYRELPQLLNLVATEELASLPKYMKVCHVVYMPEIGYLLVIKEWKEKIEDDEIESMRANGFEYRFKLGDGLYFRSARTRELDIVLGDCLIAMYEIETGILVSLTKFVLERSKEILAAKTLLAELDCLFSMGKVARDRNYVRPLISPTPSGFQIINGRHCLSEIITPFVPNSTSFEEERRVILLTGPNSSGKSVYLKQIGLITLLALSGSFVPASSATIPIFDKIFAKVYIPESSKLQISSFLIDVNQVSNALHNSTESSLVLIDEFGNGTNEVDGSSLLTAVVENFLSRREKSPYMILTTHFFSVPKRLSLNPLLKLQTMMYLGGDLEVTYLFKIKDGLGASSFAYAAAKAAGIPNEIIEQSKKIEMLIESAGHANRVTFQMLRGFFNNFIKPGKMDSILQAFQKFISTDFEDYDREDPEIFLDYVRHRLTPYFHRAKIVSDSSSKFDETTSSYNPANTQKSSLVLSSQKTDLFESQRSDVIIDSQKSSFIPPSSTQNSKISLRGQSSKSVSSFIQSFQNTPKRKFGVSNSNSNVFDSTRSTVSTKTSEGSKRVSHENLHNQPSKIPRRLIFTTPISDGKSNSNNNLPPPNFPNFFSPAPFISSMPIFAKEAEYDAFLSQATWRYGQNFGRNIENVENMNTNNHNDSSGIVMSESERFRQFRESQNVQVSDETSESTFSKGSKSTIMSPYHKSFISSP